MSPGLRVEEIVANFEAEASRGETPKAVPTWQEEDGLLDSDDTCILYNIMKLYLSKGGKEGSFGESLASVVSSVGYSREGDMSLGWAVASILASLGVAPYLSAEEATRFCSSYADQLLEIEMWDKAVYVLLTMASFVSNADKEAVSELGRSMAKDIIARNAGSSEGMGKSRSFLESLGVSPAVFEEVSAIFTRLVSDAKSDFDSNAINTPPLPLRLVPFVEGSRHSRWVQRRRHRIVQARHQGRDARPRYCKHRPRDAAFRWRGGGGAAARASGTTERSGRNRMACVGLCERMRPRAFVLRCEGEAPRPS